MRILVTGGTGFIGPYIVSRLVDDAHAVRVLEHDSRKQRGAAEPGGGPGRR